ncbi:MAG TPA: hypothetical protein PLP73_00825 [Candidatus Absconditabacterales bacterium]|nr:hypothetical protein [Candidatus Absconditabacterales bacterium]HRU50118.1 hypothetical protein [Candidatus Absconditabacterales bacterium]
MKFLKHTLSIFLFSIVMIGTSLAQHGKWGDYGSNPMQIFNTFVDNANDEGNYNIQETALDGVTDQQGGYARSFKITNTLDYIRNNLDPYIQRAIYVGLVLAVIAVIYLGFLLVTNAVHKEGDWTKIKTKIGYVVMGVLLLGGFYFIIKVMVALITSLFGGSTGHSGY